MKHLSEKVAIITGSSSGIGKAIALRLGEEGVKIAVAARRLDLCNTVKDHISARGGKAIAVQTDISDQTQVDNLIDKTIDHFGQIDIMVNNAGIGGGNQISETTTETFDQVINTNLRGTFFCCRAGFRQMRNQGTGGIIINVSSVCGIDAWSGTGSYSASKYGIMGITKALADEGRNYKIKASAICPGGVASSLVDQSVEEIEASGAISPYDIAETVIYLAALSSNTVVHQVIVDRIGAEW